MLAAVPLSAGDAVLTLSCAYSAVKTAVGRAAASAGASVVEVEFDMEVRSVDVSNQSGAVHSDYAPQQQKVLYKANLPNNGTVQIQQMCTRGDANSITSTSRICDAQCTIASVWENSDHGFE